MKHNHSSIKRKSIIVIVVILSLLLAGCGNISNKDLENHGYWYGSVPDNRNGEGEITIIFSGDGMASVWLEDSLGWLSGGECSYSITSSTIKLKSIDGEIIESPLADNGVYTLKYEYEKNSEKLILRWDGIQLKEGFSSLVFSLLMD